MQVADSGEIELHASQRLPRDGPIPALIVALSPSLDVIRRGASDSFAEVHAQLERQRALDHPFDRCSWRTPPVRKWTAAHGWEELR